MLPHTEAGGWVIACFLDFEGRKKLNYPLASVVTVTRILSGQFGLARQPKYLPWLRKGGSVNWGFLSADEAIVYWSTRKTACKLFRSAGFEIKACFSQKMFQKRAFKRFSPGGVLYLVARKSATAESVN